MSTPTPGPADDDEPRAGGDELGVDLDLAADDRARRSRAGSPRSSSRLTARCARRPRGAARRSSTPSLRDGLGDEDPHAPAPAAAGVDDARTTRARRPGRRRPPAPARPGGPARSRRSRACSIAPRISSRVTEPRWPSRKILPVSLPWPPARTRPRRLSSPLNAFQSRPSGTMRRGDGPRGVARVGEQLEAERRRGRPAPPRRRPRGGRRSPSAPSARHQPEALVDLVDDGDRRRARRLAVRRGSRDGRAGRGRSAASSPSPSPPRPAPTPRSSPGPGRTSRPSASR